MKKKVYNWPFWVMLFNAVSYGSYYVYNLTQDLDLLTNSTWFNRFYLLLGFFWIALLLAQALYYRLLRKKIVNIKWVRLHVLLTFAAFSSAELLTLASFLEFYNGGRKAHYCAQQLFTVSDYAFYLFMLIGNAFFITTIVTVFKRNNTVDIDNEQPPGILDGILDEY